MMGKWVASATAALRRPGVPDEAAIKRRVAGRRRGIAWHWIEIGAGHPASTWEARQFETEPGRTLFPVRVAYSVAGTRDYVSTYYAFRGCGRGGWDVRSNARRDDVFGIVRTA